MRQWMLRDQNLAFPLPEPAPSPSLGSPNLPPKPLDLPRPSSEEYLTDGWELFGALLRHHSHLIDLFLCRNQTLGYRRFLSHHSLQSFLFFFFFTVSLGSSFQQIKSSSLNDVLSLGLLWPVCGVGGNDLCFISHGWYSDCGEGVLPGYLFIFVICQHFPNPKVLGSNYTRLIPGRTAGWGCSGR
jgi:hypothetical protein